MKASKARRRARTSDQTPPRGRTDLSMSDSKRANAELLLHAFAQQLDDVQSLAIAVQLDLLAAAEAVGDDRGPVVELTDARQKHAFADRATDVERFLRHSECARHSATALRRPLDREAEMFEQPLFAVEADDCVMMAMRLHER